SRPSSLAGGRGRTSPSASYPRNEPISDDALLVVLDAEAELHSVTSSVDALEVTARVGPTHDTSNPLYGRSRIVGSTRAAGRCVALLWQRTRACAGRWPSRTSS